MNGSSRRHILIAGGTGFVGRALCSALSRHDYNPIVLTRQPHQARVHLGGLAHCIDHLSQLVHPVEAIINLAGENLGSARWTSARKRALLESRLHTTQDLVACAREIGAKTMISASAIGWYGHRHDTPLTETSAATTDDDFGALLCRHWEQEAQQVETTGTRLCIARLGVVLDQGAPILKRLTQPFRLGLGSCLGPGTQWFSWIHRHDLTALLMWMLHRPDARGVYNATAPAPITHEQLSQTLAKALNSPVRMKIPAPVLRSVMGEQASLVPASQRVLPYRAMQQGFTFRYPLIEPALSHALAA